MKKKKINLGHIIIYIVLISGVFITVFPLAWMILTSLKTQSEAIRIPIQIFPSNWLFSNYIAVFQKIPFAKIYITTIINTIIIVVSQLVICSMAAYAFARIKFPFKEVIFNVLLAVLMIPSSFFILPQYQIVQSLGLLNSLPAIFLLRQFFMALPNELEDAARIDGCSRFMIFVKIMLPLVRSGLIALGILTLRFAWNDLMWPMIVNTASEKMTLSAGLALLQGQYVTEYPIMMSGAVMAVLPLLISFAIFQKQFIEGIAIQGIKG